MSSYMAQDIVWGFDGLLHEDTDLADKVLLDLVQAQTQFKFRKVRLLELDFVPSVEDDLDWLWAEICERHYLSLNGGGIGGRTPDEEEEADAAAGDMSIPINARTLRLLANRRLNSGFGSRAARAPVSDRHRKLNKRNFRQVNWKKRQLDLESAYYGCYLYYTK